MVTQINANQKKLFIISSGYDRIELSTQNLIKMTQKTQKRSKMMTSSRLSIFISDTLSLPSKHNS